MEMLPPPVEIRQLTPEEYLSLAPRFEERGFSLPNPATSTAVGIFDNGKLVGYQVLQIRLHAQPTEIDPHYAGMFSALCRKSEQVVLEKCGPTWVYTFIEPGDMEKLAVSRGLVEEPWKVYSKLVERRDAPVFEVKPLVSEPVSEPLSEPPMPPINLEETPVEGGVQ